MTAKLFIPVILGTNREGRQSEHVVRFVFSEMQKHAAIETQFIDIRDFALPSDNYGSSLKEEFSDYRDTIARADGMVLVVPEYNHSFPGVLKSVLDILYEEYNHKAAGLIGVSIGPWGGVRVVESLLPVLKAFGMTITSPDLNFSNVGDIFDEKGKMQDAETYSKRAAGFLDELAWVAQALRWGRENL